MDLDNRRNLVSLSVKGCLESWKRSELSSTRGIHFESSHHARDLSGGQIFTCLAVSSKVGNVNFNPIPNRAVQTPRRSQPNSGTLTMKKSYAGAKGAYYPERSILRIVTCWKRLPAAYSL
ncbi:hypothetical protein BOTCAL_0003g00580 [Botryotinia calthae]|uniref:Uncharacterized protein n=1 Tax=Botryotinia calthae TaxID=38488 RepID=A0A4Y8DHS9_9HELO|nr:hypothetical protein BOTCAL_0003g00580 [Botryotinia calthae]